MRTRVRPNAGWTAPQTASQQRNQSPLPTQLSDAMHQYPPTKNTRLKRLPKRGSFDQSVIHQIIDEALICHVGFVIDGQPSVIPTSIVRIENAIFIHGSRVSRMLKHLAEGAPACITVTHLDGLILARSGFQHSANYRSVVVYGNGKLVEKDRKPAILDAFVEGLVPGRLADVRPISRKELNATSVIEFALTQSSAKIRSGGPEDDAADYALPIWAGELPLKQKWGPAIADPKMTMDILVPGYVKRYRR